MDKKDKQNNNNKIEQIKNGNVLNSQLSIEDLSNNENESQEKQPALKQKKHKKLDEREEKFEYNNEGIVTKNLTDVLHDSMIPYTEHVVMDRALPRVEDGLKPVQRRILYSMMELGVTPDKPYRKSARIVGDCMGKYHPHGDSSVYDAMVRMAQNYSLREPLVDGHGNFGSIDGDSAAAMRYTEAKLAPLALELLRDLDKKTVSWSLNFDDSTREPDMLPGRFPNLLVNGAYGIAVGLATNIPPHNLSEVIDGVCAYIKNPKITLKQMMKHIKAPDFPTGGIIVAGSGLEEAYRTGKGKIILKAKTHIETDGDKSDIVIDEMPYQVNKAMLLQRIAELREKEKNGILSYVGEIRDESDRNGMRAVVKVKKDGNVNAIMKYLFKNTNLEMSYNFNMVAIAGGKPKQMGLLDIISYYSEYQREVIYRRTKFDLDNALAREHIIKGLLICIANIDEIIAIIKKSSQVSEAKQKIMARFELSELQAQAILDMRIARLVNLEVKKLEEEYAEVVKKIAEYRLIIESKEKQFEVILSEIKDIKKRYENPRKSQLVFVDDKVEVVEDKQNTETEEEEEFTELNHITLSPDYRLKRVLIKNNVNVKSTTIAGTMSEINSFVIKEFDNKQILAFTNKGNCLKINIKDLPLVQWKTKGFLLCEINKKIKFDENVVSILPILEDENNKDKKIIMFTKEGMAKVSLVSEYLVNRAMFLAMNIRDSDEIVSVEYLNEETDNLIAITKNAYALKFKSSELPIQKRVSVGMKVVKLDKNDELIAGNQTRKIGSVMLVAKNGYAKKVPIGEYDILPRYRKGLKTIYLTDSNDCVVFAKFSLENFDFAVKTKAKIKGFSTDKIKYDSRIAKGKQIEKTAIELCAVMIDKSQI